MTSPLRTRGDARRVRGFSGKRRSAEEGDVQNRAGHARERLARNPERQGDERPIRTGQHRAEGNRHHRVAVARSASLSARRAAVAIVRATQIEADRRTGGKGDEQGEQGEGEGLHASATLPEVRAKRGRLR